MILRIAAPALWSLLVVGQLAYGQPGKVEPFRPEIPRIWVESELESWTIPPREPGVHKVHVSSHLYYSIPIRPIYKSYAIYHPAKEPKGYYEWLKTLEPEVAFEAQEHETKGDWEAAGKLVFEAPLFFDSADQFRDSALYLELGILLSQDGIVPGHGYVVREKGVVEALELDDVVIGGGNVTKLDTLPPGCRVGDNALAFRGRFLLWEKDGRRRGGAHVTASVQSSPKN